MRIADVSLVTGFDNIRPDDQDKITDFINGKATAAASSSSSKPSSTATAAGGVAAGDEGSYVIEYAKSNRSTCVVCSEKIEKEVVRVGRMERAAQFDGITPRWAHLACTQQREKIDDVSLLHGLDNLRQEDQEDVQAVVDGRPIKERMEVDNGDNEEEDAKKGKKAKKGKAASKKKGKRGRDEDDEEEEEADEGETKKKKKGKTAKAEKGGKSGAAAAVEDEEAVEAEDEMDYGSMTAAQLKQECKTHDLSTAGAKAKLVERLTEWQTQQKQQKKKKVTTTSTTASSSSASSSSASSSSPSSSSPTKVDNPQEAEYEKQLKEEGTLRWSIRDPLKQNLSTSQIKHVVEQLGLPTHGGPDRLLDTLTDCMMYGMPAACPECGHSGVYYKEGKYHCGGIASAWAKCGWTADDIDRTEFVVPDGWEELAPFDTYQWKAHSKPLEAHRHKAEQAATKQQALSKHREEAEAKKEERRVREEKKADEANVLCSLRILPHGKAFSTPLSELKAIIQERGGAVARAVKDADVVLCVASVVQAGKGKVLKDANESGKPIVSEQWLLDSLEKKEMQPLKSYLLSEDEAVLDDAQKLLDTKKQEKQQQKSGSSSDKQGSGKSGFGKSGKSGKLRLQKGARAAVDPDSGLDESGHILEQSADEIYAVSMSIADVQTGHNSFYILQLIEGNTGSTYHVFRKWGRLGTEQGHSKLTAYGSKAEAVREFCEVYLDKTGNAWHNRHEFDKKFGKFNIVEQDYSQDNELAGIEESEADDVESSKLQPAVQSVVRMLFDVKQMQRVLLEMDIDMDKMPLGKLSRAHIQKGYDCLSEIQDLIAENNEHGLIAACNKFYSIIPRSFGNKKPPVINTLDMLKAELEMVESLLDMSTAVGMLKVEKKAEKDEEGKQEKTRPPSAIDLHYQKLNTDMRALERDDPTYALVSQYLQNTHAETHRAYDLELLDVFELEREGEAGRFSAHQKDPNRMLLWHGSRTTNFVGILSQGLRIAPPEAPSTGFMFGKGMAASASTPPLPLRLLLYRHSHTLCCCCVYFVDRCLLC